MVKTKANEVHVSRQEELSELNHARQVICQKLERFKSFIYEHGDEIFQIESRLKTIKDDFSDFDKFQTRLEFLVPEEKDNRLETESDFYTVISTANKIIADFKKENEKIEFEEKNRIYLDLSRSNNQNIEHGNTGPSATRAIAKLPELGLPSFYGRYETWYSFKDIFDSVVNKRTDLTEIDKFLYLKICCKSDALRLIESLDVTAANYTIALDILQKRYENKRAIINHHVNNLLFNLPHVSKESSNQIRSLLDTVHQHKSALEKLHLPVNHWDLMLIPVILQKLDDKTKREWESKQSDQNLPTLNQLIEFLTKKCFTLEAINSEFSKLPSNYKSSYRRTEHSDAIPRGTAGNKCFFAHQEHRPWDTTHKIKCQHCHENHYIYQCQKFAGLSNPEKYNVIRKYHICSNCLRTGHLRNDCKSSGCRKCNFKHNTILHIDKSHNTNSTNRQLASDTTTHQVHIVTDAVETQNSLGQLETSNNALAASTMCAIDRNQIEGCLENDQNQIISNSNKNILINQTLNTSYTSFSANQVLLSTATLYILDYHGYWHECHALLDSGSQSNLMSESLCKKLNLKCERIHIPLSGINQIITNISLKTNSTIKSRNNSFRANLSFLVLPKITEKLPLYEFDKNVLVYPKNISLADNNFNIPKEIDLLLGAGIFYDLLDQGKIKLGRNMPILQETRLGWIITGNLNFINKNNQKSVCNFLKNITNNDLNETLIKFWKLEELPKDTFLSKDEQICEDIFKETTTRNQDGKFIVRYPFKQNFNNLLGDSKTVALKRFKSLERRFERNKDLKQQYVEFMKEYENLDHMTFKCNLENDDSIESESYFLPHTAVLRDSITTKCRVVFDASAKTNTDISLNDLLLTGPTIQPDLFDILLRLRLRKYVLNADIKMMYRFILINPDEQCFQQILWRSNCDEPIQIFRLKTVTYGTSSAPFQATRCLKELAILNEKKYPRTAKIIQNCFYMDDLLTSVDTKDEAIEIYHELTEIMSQAKFELRKWSSNDNSILNYISKVSKSNDDKLILFHVQKEMKTLGITWDANEDTLKYSIRVIINEKTVTKRSILSAIAKIFDPLGLVGPAIITAKLIIQELWLLKVDWDQEIPTNLKQRWLDFASELGFLKNVTINRQVLLSNAISVSLYGFSDSSEKAYGACVYLCSIDKDGNQAIRLLTAKSKVVPIKKQTIARLELLAAHLLAELVYKVKIILDINISNCTYFTDSTIVLAWLKIEPCKLKTFVANRVSKISELSNIEQWRHVKSSDNAADIISRGLTPRELLQSDMWFNGPNFLRNPDIICDSFYEKLQLESIPELKNDTVTLNIAQPENQFNIFNKYSTLFKLLQVIGYICRFKNRTLKKLPAESNVLSVDELDEALLLIIRLAQKESFKQEIQDLKKLKHVSNTSKILNLNPFLDSNSILRTGGRLIHSKIDFNQRHPIILPYEHNLTNLIILDLHLKHLHAGSQTLLSIIRLKYWPIHGKTSVKRNLKKCFACFRASPKPVKFLMGPLPSSRVNPSRPFSSCGVDYAGPIYVKEGTLRRSKQVKTYICIFVCFATRAVHIELVSNLTTNGFLNALKRFCSRRGKPCNIYSDNGLNFVGANYYFIELYNLINDKSHNNAVFSFLANEKIKWFFNPARSAHMGGIWEAAIKSTKFHLKRALGNDTSLSFEEMNTLLIQIEACLNSRPLTPLSNDVNDYTPLTPSHFLIGDSLASSPEAEFNDIKISRLSRYQRLQQLFQQFWNRWSKEYLSNLQTRSKWKKDIPNTLEIGTLVVLVEDNLPPLRWPMARVIELHRGLDNIVRVVSVRLANGSILKRSVAKVCILPGNSEED